MVDEVITKLAALTILADMDEATVESFAAKLRDEGYTVAGPRKSFNILSRMVAQGLVRRDTRQERVRYALPGGIPVERGQRKVYYMVTEKGIQRRDWLETHQEGAE